MGGHVNVSCTSYIQYCHAAEISGIVYYVTGCYAADGVGWGGVGGHVNVPCTSYIQYCHAAEISGIVYYVTGCYAADGVGWGGVGGHVNVPCTSYIQYCHAAEISGIGIVYYVTGCCVSPTQSIYPQDCSKSFHSSLSSRHSNDRQGMAFIKV